MQQFSGKVVGSEQCLTLVAYLVETNITVYRPCLLWMHGGWFLTGDSLQHGLTSGEFFAGVRDVIVVSVQYRLAVQGFLALEDLDDETEGRWGVYGFQDQHQALKWVHNTASCFSGQMQALFRYASASFQNAHLLAALSQAR